MTTQDVKQQFADELRRARRQDGEPSYRDLNKRMRARYSIASISRALSGTSFPRWEFTENFLRACHVSDAEIAGPWFSAWKEAADVISPIGQAPDDGKAGAAAPDPAAQYTGAQCPQCGAWIINPLRHQAWHATHIEREPRRRSSQWQTQETTGTGRPLHKLPG